MTELQVTVAPQEATPPSVLVIDNKIYLQISDARSYFHWLAGRSRVILAILGYARDQETDKDRQDLLRAEAEFLTQEMEAVFSHFEHSFDV